MASSAIRFPILPELRLVITRIGSIYSIVPPAVTKIFFSKKKDLVELVNLVITDCNICSGETTFAFPSVIVGCKKSTP
jgi:hypothetical protein